VVKPRTSTPIATDGIQLTAKGEDVESFINNYHLDGSDDYSLSEKLVHYLGCFVTPNQ
jgi:hypothetical protein